jgi:hypothetical protein
MLTHEQEELLEAIEEAMIKFPMLRLGQLISNSLESYLHTTDLTSIFYTPDTLLTTALKTFQEEHTQ